MNRNIKNAVYHRELLEILHVAAADWRLFDEFLEDLLTPREIIDIAARWQIIKQLNRGITQRDIAKNLHVSISKITRGSREFSNKNGGFARVLSYAYSNRRNRKN